MKTVLIVDDLESVRFYHEHLLGQAGFRTLTAKNGVEALAVLAVQPVDLVMLDVVMPEMSGLELLDRMRAQRDQDGLPVLIVSSEAQRSPVVAVSSASATTILQKPIAPGVLIAAVRQLVD